MQQTLLEHITNLEGRISNLRKRLESDVDKDEREHILRQMQIASVALDSYRRAYKLEQKLKS